MDKDNAVTIKSKYKLQLVYFTTQIYFVSLNLFINITIAISLIFDSVEDGTEVYLQHIFDYISWLKCCSMVFIQSLAYPFVIIQPWISQAQHGPLVTVIVQT